MKKLLLLVVLGFFLSGCVVRQSKDLTEQEKNNIKQQIIDELKEELENEYRKDLTDLETRITDIVKNEAKAVLGVSNYSVENNREVLSSTGSGVVYKKEGNDYYLITNEHVTRDADVLKIVLEDLSTISATLVGSDAITDLAVLKFTSDNYFPTVEFRETDTLESGLFAIAVGNPLGYEYYRSITVGVISGVNRRIDVDYNEDNIIDWKANLIQHDVSINPGNSGGALFDISGNLIGINNMKIVSADVSNIGFAIPISVVKPIIEELEAKGKITRTSLGIQGIEVHKIIGAPDFNLPSGVTSGIYITDIVPNSSVDGTGIQINDIIVKINDTDVSVVEDIRLMLNNFKVGDTIKLTVLRDGSPIEVDVVLKERQN